MAAKNEIIFDELDKKCIEELPTILEVLSTTGNKIAELLEPLFDDLVLFVKDGLKKPWDIKKNEKNIFYPFTEQDYSNQNKIKMLEKYFGVSSWIENAIIKNGKWMNYFYVEMGYYLDVNKMDNGFYLNICKWEKKERFGGRLFDKKFYEKLKKSCNDYKVVICHPDNGDDGESIQISTVELNTQKVQDVYKAFKEKILKEFLTNLR